MYEQPDRQEVTSSNKIVGFRRLPVAWFYACLFAVIVGWGLSIAELLVLWAFTGKPSK